MTSFQKIIKYGAIAFGVYLCIMIIGIIISVITAFMGVTIGLEIFGEKNNNQVMITKWEQEYSNITSMDVNLSICKLNIKKGDTLKVDASDVSDKFNCQVEGEKLKIEDKKLNNNFFNIGDTAPEITIYMPEDAQFKEIKLETGMNETNIEYLKADTINIEMGVGKYKIDELIAREAKIKAGAGEANIIHAQINELKLDGGIGKLALTSKIIEEADIDCGIGKVELNLIGLSTDYKIKASTGLGSFKVDGKKVQDNETIGNGETIVKVNSGIGETDIKFMEGEEIE